MAISHAQPLLLLVLVSVFFFPTLGQDFQNCNPLLTYDVKPSDLKISPYPAKYNKTMTLTITANTSKVIADSTLEFRLTSDSSLTPYTSTYSLCNVTKCPVVAGPVVFTFSTVTPTAAFSKDRLLATVDIPKKTLGQYMMCILFVIKVESG